MLLANVAKIILDVVFSANISPSASSTTDSLAEKPGTKALVESLKSNVTPSLPIAAIFPILATGPIGVKSNLKSPVSTIVPLGVLIAIPNESGIECVVVKNSILKYLVLICKSSFTGIILGILMFLSSNLFLISLPAILGVYITGISIF